MKCCPLLSWVKSSLDMVNFGSPNGPREVQSPQVLPAQPDCDADANHSGAKLPAGRRNLSQGSRCNRADGNSDSPAKSLGNRSDRPCLTSSATHMAGLSFSNLTATSTTSRLLPLRWEAPGTHQIEQSVEFHILQVGDILSVNRLFLPGKSIRKNRHEC